MVLVITQKPSNGFLGGPRNCSFSVRIKDVDYTITIEQLVIRIISIETNNGSYDDTLDIYYALEELLMLFDGQFYPVISANDGADITVSWKKRNLPNRISADFMIGTTNKLIDFNSVLDETLFQNWYHLREELDITHKMALYCLSNVDMPKDVLCGNMIELFKVLCSTVSNYKPGFSTPMNNMNRLELRAALRAVADQYGSDIFPEEFSESDKKERFIQILIQSRNRSAHIKNLPNQRYLDGTESVMYLIKLSLLYRVTLFDLLGINYNLYSKALKKRIKAIDNHSATRNFLNSIT